MSEDTAILICSHGSRDPRAVEEFALVAKALTERLPDRMVTSGFLEFAKPTITQSLQNLVDRGAKEIHAIPGMLFSAMHMKTDIPGEIVAFANKNPDVKIRFGAELGIDWRMLEAARDRIQEGMDAADAEHGKVDPEDTLLLVIGRGSSDPDANSNVAKVTRMLWDVMKFGWAETGFSGLAYPTGDVLLERELHTNLHDNGFQRVIVFPYFLFTGILIDRIYGWVDAAAEQYTNVQVVKAPYLKDHPYVIDTFMERLNRIVRDKHGVHDGLAVYRKWKAAGEPLEGEPWMKKKFEHHHHHHGEGECCGGHGHDHGHGHHHGEGECCGGHGHGHGHGHHHGEGECCGGHGHGHGHGHHHGEGECCGGHGHGHDHGHHHGEGECCGGHGHGHGIEHSHPHSHTHDHSHEHGHHHGEEECCSGHGHEHAKEHSHAHSHTHEHSHTHSDGECCGGHGHSHDNSQEHGHAHKYGDVDHKCCGGHGHKD